VGSGSFSPWYARFELKTGAGNGNYSYKREQDLVFLWGWDAGFARATEWDTGAHK